MIKAILSLLFIAFSLYTTAQDLYTVSLDEVQINLNVPNFEVFDIIDSRKDKSQIGWVQTGVFNKKKMANVAKPLEEELEELFKRSGLFSEEKSGYIIVVSRFTISEEPKVDSETGRAEVILDFFKMQNQDTCYHSGSARGISEERGMDVTSRTPENIVRAIENAISKFSSDFKWREKNDGKVFLLKDLQQGKIALKDFTDSPILNASHYTDGIFKTFDEFANNEPSITDQFGTIKGDKIKLWQIDRTGRKVKIRDNVYGFANDNTLYVLYQKNYYPLTKKGNALQFTVSGKVYEVDLQNGAFLEVKK